jgi:hypothetical protein
VVTKLRVRKRKFGPISGRGKRSCSFPKRPYVTCDPHRFLSDGFRKLLTRRQSGQSMILITYSHLVPKLETPFSPDTPLAWTGAASASLRHLVMRIRFLTFARLSVFRYNSKISSPRKRFPCFVLLFFFLKLLSLFLCCSSVVVYKI